MLLLVPSDPLSPSRPDEHFAPEAMAARDAGIEVGVVDHDALVAGRADEAVRRVQTPGDAVYRGWMVSSAQYASMAGALTGRGVALRTSPVQYRSAHELPGWYDAFVDHTPLSVWTEGRAIEDLAELVAALPKGPGVVKDYVKSLKHHWDTAMYVPAIEDLAGTRRVVDAFIAERDTDLIGGIVIRSFEQFEPGEVRTWWVDSRCVLVTAHPDAPDAYVEVPIGVLDALQPAVARLGSPFVTADIARGGGGFRVVEVGDGQVSDRPRSTPADAFIAAIAPG